MKYVPLLTMLLLVTACSSRMEGQAYDERWSSCNDDSECVMLDPNQCGYAVNKNYTDAAMRYYYPNGINKPLCVQKPASTNVECVKNKCEKSDSDEAMLLVN